MDDGSQRGWPVVFRRGKGTKGERTSGRSWRIVWRKGLGVLMMVERWHCRSKVRLLCRSRDFGRARAFAERVNEEMNQWYDGL
jgi:hypothetical protein